MYRIEQYSKDDYSLWNDFIRNSKNGTFLFHRDFMEYHCDRFEDYSLLVFDGQKLIAVLPANKTVDEVHSHDGLTYGGLVYSNALKQAAVIKVLQAVLQYLNGNGILKLYLKSIPAIYHKLPAQEMDYALFVAGAQLVRRDSLSVVEMAQGVKVAANRLEGVKKGSAGGIAVAEQEDFSIFWNELLCPVLEQKHNAKPVHSLEEITLLKKLFPAHIRLFTANHGNRIEAGAVVFETENVIHAQYIAASGDKNKTGSLDFLFYHLITEVFANKKYFDFGISNELQGRKLNEGLIFWKESFGARTITQDFYEMETKNYELLDNVLI
jgi:hypothetical protein